jgi:hypothetical protein
MTRSWMRRSLLVSSRGGGARNRASSADLTSRKLSSLLPRANLHAAASYARVASLGDAEHADPDVLAGGGDGGGKRFVWPRDDAAEVCRAKRGATMRWHGVSGMKWGSNTSRGEGLRARLRDIDRARLHSVYVTCAGLK